VPTVLGKNTNYKERKMATNNKTAEATYAHARRAFQGKKLFQAVAGLRRIFVRKGLQRKRKERVHTVGPKKGLELDDYNKGLRSGYLLCQSDHAGRYRYDQAREAGKSKKEALEYSFQRGTKKSKEEK